MKIRLAMRCAIPLLVLLGACGETQRTAQPEEVAASGDALEDRLHAVLGRYTETGLLPGVVAGLATGGGTVYVEAAGKRDLESGDPMAEDTIIAIASMTKPITTVAVLQLVEKGLVDLDAPITDYLPELEAIKVLEGFDEAGELILVDPASRPTTRQLLTHTSGFAYEFWNEKIEKAVSSGKLTSLFAGPDGLQTPLVFSPGARWEYGIGIDWAGFLVEKLSGKGLDAYFQDHIFDPLKMVDTFYVVPDDKQRRLANTYTRTPDGFEFSPPLAPMVLGGSGLYSTIDDYLRFMRALLNGGTLDGVKILESETVDLMFENQIGAIEVRPGKTRMPAFSNDFDMGFGVPARWGLGFLLHEEGALAGRAAGSVSWAGIFNSYFWIDRENDLCAVVATQVLPFYDEQAVSLLQAYEAAIYQSLPGSEAM